MEYVAQVRDIIYQGYALQISGWARGSGHGREILCPLFSSVSKNGGSEMSYIWRRVQETGIIWTFLSFVQNFDLATGLHNLFHLPSGMGARGEHEDVFLFSNSENRAHLLIFR